MPLRPLACLLPLVVACHVIAADPAPADRLGALKEQLSKPIDVQFTDVPLRRAIENIQTQTGVTFVVEQTNLGEQLDSRIMLQTQKTPADEVLDLVLRQVDAAWEVSNRTVIVSSQRAMLERSVRTSVYDIKPLLVAIPNFKAPTFDLNQALSNTNSGGSDARMSEAKGGGSGSSLFGDADIESQTANRDETTQAIITLIQDSVGDAGAWKALGGDLASIRELNGNLIVRAPASYQAQVGSLLDELLRREVRLVQLDALVVEAPTAAVGGLLKGEGPRHTLSPADAKAAIEGLAANGAVRRLGLLRTVCFNGQRVYLAAGDQMLFLSDAQPIPDGDGVDPTLSTSRTGVVLDVEPTISEHQGKAVILTLRGELSQRHALRSNTLLASGRGEMPHVSGQATATDAPAPSDKKDAPPPAPRNFDVTGRVQPATTGTTTAVTLEMPHHQSVEFRASVRIPDGGCAVLSGVSIANTAVRPDHEVVLLIRARASE